MPNFQFENFDKKVGITKKFIEKSSKLKIQVKLKTRIDFANISGLSENTVGTQVRSLESNDRAIKSIGSNKIKELISIYQGITNPSQTTLKCMTT